MAKRKSHIKKDGFEKYFYDQDLLIYIISYDADYPDFIMYKIKYYYDRNDNLVKRTLDNNMPWSLSNNIFDSWVYEYK